MNRIILSFLFHLFVSILLQESQEKISPLEAFLEDLFVETKSIFTIGVDGDGDCGGNAIVETFTLDLE